MTWGYLLAGVVGLCLGWSLAIWFAWAVGWFRRPSDWSSLDSCRAPPPGYDRRRFKQ
jgi:hypothetical protein